MAAATLRTQLMSESPAQMFRRAQQAARLPGLIIGLHYPTPLSWQAPPVDDQIFAGATASYESLTNVEVVDPDNTRRQVILGALDKLKSWGWSNTVKKVNKIETALGCVDVALRLLDAGGMAPWFAPDRQFWEVNLLGRRLCVPVALRDFYWRGFFKVPTKYRLILIRPNQITSQSQEESAARLILEEALHHEYYPFWGPCLECEPDHYGIEVAKIVTDYVKTAPTFLMNLTPKVYPIPVAPPQTRLDDVEQRLADWGLGKWVDAVVPSDYFYYSDRNDQFPSQEKTLYAGESNTLWTLKIVLASLTLTVDNQPFPPYQAPHSSSEKYQAKWRGFAALMSRINRLNEVYQANTYYALVMKTS